MSRPHRHPRQLPGSISPKARAEPAQDLDKVGEAPHDLYAIFLSPSFIMTETAAECLRFVKAE